MFPLGRNANANADPGAVDGDRTARQAEDRWSIRETNLCALTAVGALAALLVFEPGDQVAVCERHTLNLERSKPLDYGPFGLLAINQLHNVFVATDLPRGGVM
jgi:hypothetical protein